MNFKYFDIFQASVLDEFLDFPLNAVQNGGPACYSLISKALVNGVFDALGFGQEEGLAKSEKRFFECNEYEALYEAPPDYLKPVLAFGYFSGWRVMEILSLKWNQAGFEQGRV